MLQRVGNRLDLRVSVGNVLWDIPALDSAIAQGVASRYQLPFGDASRDNLRQSIEPRFRCYVRLSLFNHRRHDRNGVTDGDFRRTPISVFKNDLVDIRQDIDRLPIHIGDNDVATFLRESTLCQAGKANCKTGRCEQFTKHSGSP